MDRTRLEKEIAFRLEKNGIAELCRNNKKAKELELSLNKLGVRTLLCKADVSNDKEVEKMVNSIVDHFGTIDVLVNNASVCRDSLLLDKTVKNFRRILDVCGLN